MITFNFNLNLHNKAIQLTNFFSPYVEYSEIKSKRSKHIWSNAERSNVEETSYEQKVDWIIESETRKRSRF